MEAYYSNQASQSMPHFYGHYRQRGSGFGALAAGIGRVALPLAKKNYMARCQKNWSRAFTAECTRVG